MTREEFLTKYAVDRRGTDSVKWDKVGKIYGNPDATPMFIADMDFSIPETVQQAIKDRVTDGAFGYTVVGAHYYEALALWLEERHNYTIDTTWVRVTTGVVNAIYRALYALTQPGDSVMILTPVYPPFHFAVKDTERRLVQCDLFRDGDYRYHIDFECVTAAIEEHNVKAIVFCNPHNPVGRVWTEAEMNRLFQICADHDVLIISDEIHQDIILGETPFTPALTVGDGQFQDRLIVLGAATKTFNLASLPMSHVIIPNQELRRAYDVQVNKMDHCEPSVLSMIATEMAYRIGAEWLDALLDVIRENDSLFRTTLLEKAPKLAISPLEGTYLTWVDFAAYVAPADLKAFLVETCNVAPNWGETFARNCRTFARFNLATTPENVVAVAERIGDALQKLQK